MSRERKLQKNDFSLVMIERFLELKEEILNQANQDEIRFPLLIEKLFDLVDEIDAFDFSSSLLFTVEDVQNKLRKLQLNQSNNKFHIKKTQRNSPCEFKAAQIRTFLSTINQLGYYKFTYDGPIPERFRGSKQKAIMIRNLPDRLKLIDDTFSKDNDDKSTVPERSQTPVHVAPSKEEMSCKQNENLKKRNTRRVKAVMAYVKLITEFITVAHLYDVEVQDGDDRGKIKLFSCSRITRHFQSFSLWKMERN